MTSFLKNNFYRIYNRRYNVLTGIFMSIVSIGLAVYFTSSLQMKGSIAVVTQNTNTVFKSQYFSFKVMDKQPSKSQMLLGKYDCVIIDNGIGKYKVETIKGEDYRRMLEDMIKNPDGFVPGANDTRGVGANVLGYLMMFILLQSMQFMFTLAQDMEQKQIERIAKAPISFVSYLLSHFISTFTIIFTPAFLTLVVMKGIFGYNIGFSLIEYAVLLEILCSFGTAFAMFINSMVKVSDTANMMGSAILTLTTILSGSFYSLEKGNEILEKVITILPQKAYLSLVQGLEGGMTVTALLPQLSYIVIISLAFFAFSIIKIKKDYVLKVD